jgi:hypothetical protein
MKGDVRRIVVDVDNHHAHHLAAVLRPTKGGLTLPIHREENRR